MLVGGLGPAPTVGHPWVGPPGDFPHANEHAAFSSGCGPYLVRMIHGQKARPIQKDGTLRRVLVGGLGPCTNRGSPVGQARQALPHAMNMRLSPRAAARA